ncbi:MAG: YihY/virulence factor BrkB family protein [Chloroflexota bacterium]|nr:YihY/virulence factor BrkB family protein [Chloroflexota bacterium]
MRLKQIPALLQATYNQWATDNCLRFGAALAFYAFSSLIPVLLIVLAIMTFVLHYTGGGQNFQQQLLHRISGVVDSPQLADQITSSLTGRTADAASKGTLGTIVGLVVLLVTASAVFSEVDAAFKIIWKVPQPAQGTRLRGFIRAKVLSFALVLGVVVLLLVSPLLTAVLTALHDVLPLGTPLAILNAPLQVGLITLIFALLFKFLPDTAVAWGDVWIGGILAALLWIVGQQLLTLYFTYFTGFSSYGALGGVLAFLFYVYFSSQILFLGAEFTHVYAKVHGSLRAVPALDVQGIG